VVTGKNNIILAQDSHPLAFSSIRRLAATLAMTASVNPMSF